MNPAQVRMPRDLRTSRRRHGVCPYTSRLHTGAMTMSLRSAGCPALPPLALGISLVGALPALAAESPLAAADRLLAATGGNVVVRYSMATGVAPCVRATGEDRKSTRLNSSH